MRGDRFPDDFVEIGRRIDRCRCGNVPGPPVVLDRVAAVRPERGPRASRKLANALDRAPLFGNPVVEHRGDERTGIDSQFGPDGGDKSLEFRGEDHAAVPRQEVEGLNPERITGEYDLARLAVEKRECVHAAETRQSLRAPASPRFKYDLGV